MTCAQGTRAWLVASDEWAGQGNEGAETLRACCNADRFTTFKIFAGARRFRRRLARATGRSDRSGGPKELRQITLFCAPPR